MKLFMRCMMLILLASGLSALAAPKTPSGIPRITDPLDKKLKFFRNTDDSNREFVQYQTYSFEIIRITGKNEGVFAVKTRWICIPRNRQLRLDSQDRTTTLPDWVCIKGFNLEGKAEGDEISLRNGLTLWRIGSKELGKRGKTLALYTTDRKEAAVYVQGKNNASNQKKEPVKRRRKGR